MRGRPRRRLVDYVCVVSSTVQEVPLLRRFPPDDHDDFPLPSNVSSFCQPEGYTAEADELAVPKDSSTFLFTLTDKDSNVTRYAVCHNFYRPLNKSSHDESRLPRNLANHDYAPMSDDEDDQQGDQWNFHKSKNTDLCLTSVCIISHFQFFSNFKECALAIRRLVTASNHMLYTRSVQRFYDAWTLFINDEAANPSAGMISLLWPPKIDQPKLI